ncbi:hypothetical protein MHYP_G00296240 [Metynnis hypsauchen]
MPHVFSLGAQRDRPFRTSFLRTVSDETSRPRDGKVTQAELPVILLRRVSIPSALLSSALSDRKSRNPSVFLLAVSEPAALRLSSASQESIRDRVSRSGSGSAEFRSDREHPAENTFIC